MISNIICKISNEQHYLQNLKWTAEDIWNLILFVIMQTKSKISNIISRISNTICKISKPISENHNIASIQILICNIAKKVKDLKHNHEDIWNFAGTPEAKAANSSTCVDIQYILLAINLKVSIKFQYKTNHW